MKTHSRRQNPTLNDTNAQERAVQALKLRKLGFDYDEIAKQCGYSNRGGAWNAIHRALSRQKQEAVEELRTLEAQRLDDLMRPFMLRAMKGESEAAAVVLRIMARRDALLGLDIVRSPAGRPPEEVRREYIGIDVADLIARANHPPISANGRGADTVQH